MYAIRSYYENLAFVRLYSGCLAVGDKVYNPAKQKQEKISSYNFV